MSTKASAKGNKVKASVKTNKPNRTTWNAILRMIGAWRGHFALYLHYIQDSGIYRETVWGKHADFKSWYNATRDGMPSDSADMPSYDYATKFASTASTLLALGKSEKQIQELRNFTNAIALKSQMSEANVTSIYHDVDKGMKTKDLAEKYGKKASKKKGGGGGGGGGGQKAQTPDEILKGIMKDTNVSSVKNLWNLRISKMNESDLKSLKKLIDDKLATFVKARKVDLKPGYSQQTSDGVPAPKGSEEVLTMQSTDAEKQAARDANAKKKPAKRKRTKRTSTNGKASTRKATKVA